MNFIDFSSEIPDFPYEQSPIITGLIRNFEQASAPQPVNKEVQCEVCKIAVSSFVSKFSSIFM